MNKGEGIITIGARGEILQQAELGTKFSDDCSMTRREPSKPCIVKRNGHFRWIRLAGDRISVASFTTKGVDIYRGINSEECCAGPCILENVKILESRKPM
jgi:hypothetical protein